MIESNHIPSPISTAYAQLDIHDVDDIIHYVNTSRGQQLLPLFRSKHQFDLFAFLFLQSDRPHSVTQIARQTKIPQPTVSRELARLESADLIAATQIGRSRLVKVNTQHPYYPELASLILKAAGPAYEIGRRLRKIRGLEAAYIYGSWARRYLGEPGHHPRDVDVLVIGNPDPDEVDEACIRVGRKIGLEINPVIATPEEWRSRASGFLKQLHKAPLLALLESDEDGQP